jgi:H+/gluconate symporter-like permease
MVAIIISIVSSVVAGMVLYFLQHYFKKKEKNDETREKIQNDKDKLVIKSINAVGNLTVANSIALRDGKTNGEMHKALNDYKKVETEMLNFLIENSNK